MTHVQNFSDLIFLMAIRGYKYSPMESGRKHYVFYEPGKSIPLVFVKQTDVLEFMKRRGIA